MLSFAQRTSATFTLCILLLTLFARVSWADTLVMPRELVDFAHANGCTPIDNFFERPGMVNPPYVYGWLSGDQEKSAVFWCKRAEKNDKPYILMFKARNPKQLAGCPAIVEWWNPPGGLSIETRRRLALRNFRYVTVPQRAGPASVVTNAKVIVNYYDGLTDVFYCYKGRWLVARTE
jgi:hypothetical protein